MFGLLTKIPLKYIFGSLAVLAVVGMIVAGYIHYQGVLSDRERLQAQVVELEEVTTEQENVIQGLQRDIILKDRAIARLNDRERELREQEELLRSRLSSLLRGIDTNEGAGATVSRTEEAINEEMAMRLRCVELATGARLTEGELTGNVTNTVCPELLGSN